MERIFDLLQVILIWVVCIVIASVTVGTIVMFLWNWLMPDIFGLPSLSWLQAVGFMFLIQCLFRTEIKYKKENNKTRIQ